MAYFIFFLNSVKYDAQPIHNHYAMAYIGWALYNLYLLQKGQKEFDTDNNGYSLKELFAWVRYNSISLILSGMLVYVCVPYTHDIWNWTFNSTEFVDIGYYGIGFVMILVQKLIKKLST